jgi:hypothetical protein
MPGDGKTNLGDFISSAPVKLLKKGAGLTPLLKNKRGADPAPFLNCASI